MLFLIASERYCVSAVIFGFWAFAKCFFFTRFGDVLSLYVFALDFWVILKVFDSNFGFVNSNVYLSMLARSVFVVYCNIELVESI